MSASMLSLSRLLALPVQLKNRISPLVLLDDAADIFRDTGQNRPALMNTSKQVRTDTNKTYYGENKFEVPVHNFNFDLVLKMEGVSPICQQQHRYYSFHSHLSGDIPAQTRSRLGKQLG